MSARPAVVGLGQRAAGDDGVGLVVLGELERRGAADRVDLVPLSDPMGLVDILGRVSRVVIVDAVLAHPIGAVLELSPDELSEAAPQPASSHGMGAAQALRLASALAPEATERVRVVAIAIARPAAYRDGLSPQVAAAVPIAADRVLSIVGG